MISTVDWAKVLDWTNWVLTVIGLVIVAVGAFVAARAVIIDDLQAKALSLTYWDQNVGLMTALIEQSTAAKRGLYLVAGGSCFQILAVVAQAARSLIA